MPTKALITGITGMVGSHLADFLLENTDWEIYGACRWRSPLDNVSHLLDRVNRKDRVFFEYADLNDQVSLLTVLRKVKPDYIFHLAAQSYPMTSFDAPIDTLNTNILGTCRLLEAVRAYYMLVTMDPIPGEYYNIGGSYTCTVGDTLHTLLSFSQEKGRIRVEVDQERLRPIDADLQIPDCRKFKRHTGWEPQIPYGKTMEDLLDYWRARVRRGESFLTR